MKTKFPILILGVFFLLHCKEQNAEKTADSKTEKSKIINSNRFIKPEDIKGKNFDVLMDEMYAKPGILQKYLPLESETFILGDNDSYVAGIREGLLNLHSMEEIEKKDILIKEVTWEISDTQFFTVWYERKNRQWIPIQDYIWDKGANF